MADDSNNNEGSNDMRNSIAGGIAVAATGFALNGLRDAIWGKTPETKVDCAEIHRLFRAHCVNKTPKTSDDKMQCDLLRGMLNKSCS